MGPKGPKWVQKAPKRELSLNPIPPTKSVCMSLENNLVGLNITISMLNVSKEPLR